MFPETGQTSVEPTRADEIPAATVRLEGRYELLDRLGHGGMGMVYRARQLYPVRRDVAIKLVKLGMDTAELLRRFEQERQALATLSHPNIAAVYDAGRTDTDRPFFAMELVDGPNLIAYCDAHRLDMRQRIGLFIKLCHAVQHAHYRGIIHRDLKPSNVLVATIDGDAIPKVIDFGIARVVAAATGDGAGALTLTGAATALGTPAYMSPEQLRGAHAADTRSDVYSLGVILCELLTGRLPFDLDKSGRPVRSEVELPPRPSTRIAQSSAPAASRGPRAVHGELDWIILRCLEPQPDRRYAAVGDLEADLQRFLRGEPTRASPPSRWRQATWFVRRHKAVVVTAATLLLAMTAGLAGTSYGLVRERRIATELARQKAEAESQRAEADRRRVEAEEAQQTVEAVNLYLTGIFRQANPQFSANWKKDLTLREALDSVAGMLAKDLESQRIVRAEVCETISQAYVSLGESEKGLPMAQMALEIREKSLGSEHPKTNAARYNLGYLLGSIGRVTEAGPLLEQSLEYSRRTYGADHPNALSDTHQLGWNRWQESRKEEAESLLRDALERKTRVFGRDHRSTMTTLNVLSALLTSLGRHAEAYPLAREAFEYRMKTYGPEHPHTLTSMVNLSIILLSLDRPAEAMAIVDDGLERSMRIHGPAHTTTRGFVRNRAVHLIRTNRRDEAIALFNQYQYDTKDLDRYLNPAATQPTTQPTSQPSSLSGRFSDSCRATTFLQHDGA